MQENKFREGIVKKIADTIAVDPEDIIDDAQEFGIQVSEFVDFKDPEKIKRHDIERLSRKYSNLAARYSAASGAVTGAGSIITVAALSVGDLGNLAAQLFRLNQRLAILHGFNPNNAIHHDKVLGFYLTALGIDGIAQTGIRNMVAKAIAEDATKKGPAKAVGIRIIMEVVKLLGLSMTKNQAAKLVPFVGMGLGAGVNYLFAKKAAKNLMRSYRLDAQDRAEAP